MGEPMPARSPASGDPAAPSRPVWRQNRLLNLRSQVERGTYAVDAADVAESIIDAALELLPPATESRL